MTTVKKVTKEGLLIPLDTLKKLGLEEDIEVLTKKHSIVIKPKSLTDRVRGLIKGTPLSVKELEEVYSESKGATE
jgi:bifunctional DNA-binding transcriptional regulator/antitoxin component of YhaV-PrlF toxin-antitoxin module